MLKRLLCVLVVGLTGCGPTVPDSAADAPSGLARVFSKPAAQAAAKPVSTRPRLPTPLAKLSLGGGAVTVDPPKGYCIDPTTRQRNFALIASCQILTAGRSGASVAPVIATVTVGPFADGLPDPETLAEASDAVLLAAGRQANFVTAHLASGGQAGLPNGDDRYWRGVFLQGGRSIGLAVYGPKGSAVAGKDGAAMLDRIRKGIVGSDASSGAASDAEATPGLSAALGRLFGR